MENRLSMFLPLVDPARVENVAFPRVICTNGRTGIRSCRFYNFEFNMAINVSLVYEARRLVTGSNVHKFNGLIRMYEAAAIEDNPASEAAAFGFEKELMFFVEKARRLKGGL